MYCTDCGRILDAESGLCSTCSTQSSNALRPDSTLGLSGSASPSAHPRVRGSILGLSGDTTANQPPLNPDDTAKVKETSKDTTKTPPADYADSNVDSSTQVAQSRAAAAGEAAESPTSRFYALSSRYADAYKVARFIVRLGSFTKVVSIIIGCLVCCVGAYTFLIGVGAAASANPQGSQQAGLVAFIFWAMGFFVGLSGVLVGFLGYVLGVLVSAVGQIQQATLDTAVNSSPHLTNDEKASVMSLQ